MSGTYTLREVTECAMCLAPVEHAKVLGRRLNASQGARPTRRIGVTTTIMRCGNCGLVFPNPLPVPADIGQHYDMDPEAYWHPRNLQAPPDYFGPQIREFRRLHPDGGAQAALDVGAGLGLCMVALSAAGFDAHGMEPSPAFRDAAIERSGIDPDKLALTSIEDAAYDPASFDFVTFGAVLEHLPDPAVQLERALGWLRPGGLIHMEVPSADWLSGRLINRMYRLQGLDYVTNLSPMHPPYHLYEFTLRSFEAFGARAGAEVAFVRRMTGRDTFLPGPDAAWRWLMRRTGTEMQLEVWLRR